MFDHQTVRMLFVFDLFDYDRFMIDLRWATCLVMNVGANIIHMFSLTFLHAMLVVVVVVTAVSIIIFYEEERRRQRTNLTEHKSRRLDKMIRLKEAINSSL